MMRVASLLFVLSLLTAAATASAECAWVLWITSNSAAGSNLTHSGNPQ
jgi:hypothetical protein